MTTENFDYDKWWEETDNPSSRPDRLEVLCNDFYNSLSAEQKQLLQNICLTVVSQERIFETSGIIERPMFLWERLLEKDRNR